MICPNCQTPNPEDHNFCTYCGTLLVRNCPRCHSEVLEGAHFCGNCGLGLTPKAQFIWQGGWEPPPLPQPEPIKPLQVTDGTDQPTETAAVQPSPQSLTSQPLLDQYIPKELMSKLEAARRRGGMVGERRIVTMLFCDVKGSTAAAEQLDPEDWTEIINGAFEYMIKPVYKYEGTVARLTGDGILAFFGAPIAHEDDPQRAVLTGLDIVSGSTPYREKIKRRWDIDFNVRVGINTGLVVVGAVGSDLRMEYTAMGDAINLAARMEQTAAPGSVQIAHDTYKLVAPAFELEALGGIQVKGKQQPVAAYRVLGRRTVDSRRRGVEELRAELVGRGREMVRLREALEDLERGIGGVVCLVGGAGLGKSRLIQELRGDNGRAEQAHWVEAASLSYETNVPYALFQRLIRRLSGLGVEEDAERFREKLRALSEALPAAQQDGYMRVFAALFGREDGSSRPPLEGQQFQRQLYAAMEAIWQARFADQPTVLVLEDLHWADAASIELLLHLLPTVETLPLMLLCTFRPEREAPVYRVKQTAEAEYHHRYTEINLRPLSAEQSEALVDRLLETPDLPEGLRARIQERAGGNPFFVEEVVRTLIEKGAVVREDRRENGGVQRRWRAASDSAVIDIPDTLQGLLASRIDRLEEGTRHIVQLASVIGRTFYHRVLTEIGQEDGLNAQSMEGQIRRLVRLEMIQEAARVPEVEYRFRNPLMQEIAYQTILLKRRREFHRRVGEALEKLYPDQLTEIAPRLAFHFAEGRHAEKALAYYRMAGDSAFRLFALEEALANYQQALEWVERGEADNRMIVHLYRRRGRTLELLLRRDEALQTYQALEALGEARGDDSLRLAGIIAQSALPASFSQKTDFDVRARAEEALALARKLGDRAAEARSLWSLLLNLTWVDSAQALAYGERGLAIARELASPAEASNEDLELLALFLLDVSVPLIEIGQTQAAREHTAEAQKFFEHLGNLPMVSTAIQRLGLSYLPEGMYEHAEAAYERSIAIDKSIGNQGGMISSSLGLSFSYPVVGDYSSLFDTLEAIKPIVAREGRLPGAIFELYPVVAYYHLGATDLTRQLADRLLQFMDSDTALWPEYFLCYAARTHIQAGELKTGRELLAKIREDFDKENYLIPMVPALSQARAELALATGELNEALTQVDRFLEKVRQKGLRGYFPEKLLLKGRILCQTNHSEEAYDALKEAYSLATEQKARSLLWQICPQLAELEASFGNLAQSQTLKEQARAAIDFIADHAGRDDLRASFLAMPEVQLILEKDGT